MINSFVINTATEWNDKIVVQKKTTLQLYFKGGKALIGVQDIVDA